MGSKKLSLDNGSEWQIVKQLSEHFPHVVIFILPHAFVIEAIVLGDASGFVVAPENGEPLFVPNFEAEQQANGLD